MKVLFIPSELYPSDFQRETIFYGLRNLQNKGMLTYETTFVNKRLYSSHDQFVHCHYTYQKKWTEDIPSPPNRDEILEKINDRYYDCIIYNITNYELEKNQLPKLYRLYEDNLFVVNGEDGGGNEFLKGFLLEYPKLKYFKREINDGKYQDRSILPINFGFPDELIEDFPVVKKKDISSIIPGDSSTYICNNEPKYYQEYQKSKFAFTFSKCGWDCLRHLEIIFNKCIPLFLDLDHCPAYSLYFYPKFWMSHALMKLTNIDLFDIKYNEIHEKGKNLFWQDLIKSTNIKLRNQHLYEDFQQQIYQDSVRHLTCSKIVEHILHYYT